MEAAAKEGRAQKCAFRKVKELAPEEAIQSNEGWSKHRLETQDVPEASNDDLEWANTIIFGTPVRYGLPTAQLKQFIDGTGSLWQQGKLGNKIVSSFTTAANLARWSRDNPDRPQQHLLPLGGSIIVPSGYLDPYSV